MKKILILLISLCAVHSLSAQQTDRQTDPQTDQQVSPELLSMKVSEFRQMKAEKMWQEFPKFEARLGYGGFPIVDVLEFGFDGFEDMFKPFWDSTGDLENMYAPAEGATYMTGNIMAEFSWHIRKWFTLAGVMSFNGIYGSTIDPSSGAVLSRDSGVTFSFIPTARFYWANFEKCRLYSAVGLGFMTTNGYRHIKNFIPTFQLSPFGVTAGKNVFFYAEYSMGMTYLGGQLGIGYRF